MPPGPFSSSDRDRLVASTVALNADPDVNFLTPEASRAVRARLAAGGGGLVKEDRLRRMLLSSQPMCFNLFGHFQSPTMRSTLLPWVATVARTARHVSRVELEWAPPAAEHFRGGPAFDAFVEFRREDGRLGFLGIECKYHEDLKRSDVPNVRSVYRDFTATSGLWTDGAAVELDRRGLRQVWLNTLLTQSLRQRTDYAEGCCVIAACADDHAALEAVQAVRKQLLNSGDLVWQPWESIVSSIAGHEESNRGSST